MTNPMPTDQGRPIRRGRSALWFLTVPVILYLLTPLVANAIHPVVLGMPFIVFYTVGVTILTWAFIWLTAHMDPLYRTDADEPVPADLAFGEPSPGQPGRTRTLDRAGHAGGDTP